MRSQIRDRLAGWLAEEREKEERGCCAAAPSRPRACNAPAERKGHSLRPILAKCCSARSVKELGKRAIRRGAARPDEVVSRRALLVQSAAPAALPLAACTALLLRRRGTAPQLQRSLLPRNPSSLFISALLDYCTGTLLLLLLLRVQQTRTNNCCVRGWLGEPIRRASEPPPAHAHTQAAAAASL